MYVEEVVLQDFGAIAASQVPFVHPGTAEATGLRLPNVNLVVGANGSGKSTVLKAIAAVLDVARSSRTPEGASGWPRIGGTRDAVARLRLSSTDDAAEFDRQFALRIPRDDPADLTVTVGAAGSELEPAEFMVAYGSFRGTRDVGFVGNEVVDRVPHLLFENAELVPLEQWFPEARHRDEAVGLLNGLLPDDINCLEQPDRDGHVLAQRGIALPIGALSDGVRSFLAWMGDLVAQLDGIAERSIVDVEGIVLVDEIDQRMHPRWQQMVLPRLGSTFPALQFICTAHSPLLPSGLQRENLILVDPDPDFPGEGATRASRLTTEDVYGRTADQVLESSYFGLPSTRSEPFWEELRALAGRAQTKRGGRQAALEFMRRLADPNRVDSR
jgi:hypothetical protein